MGVEFGFVFHPWHSPAWCRTLVERAVGEIGLEHVTVPVLTGEMSQFRFADEEGPRVFTTEGGWHYEADPSRYTPAGVKPRIARWLGKRRPLAQISETAEKHGLKRFVQIDLRGLRTVVEQQPELGRQTAWNEALPDLSPCLNQPAIRQLLRCTIEELQSYAPADLVLEHTPDGFMLGNTFAGLDLGINDLLRICFCPACRESAEQGGADPDAASRSVQVYIRRVATEGPLTVDAAVKQDEVLKLYRGTCLASIRSWLTLLAESSPSRRPFLLTGGMLLGGHARRGFLTPERWRDLIELSPVVHQMVFEMVLKNASQHSPGYPAVRLPAFRPTFESASQLVQTVGEFAKSGIETLEFSGLDVTPSDAITWAKQAVRYARRTADLG